MTPLKSIAFLLASFGALLTTSCSGGTSSATCATGRTVECACASGAKGAQTCTASGVFSPCSCAEGTTPAAPIASAEETDVTCEQAADHMAVVIAREMHAEGSLEGFEEADLIEMFREAGLELCREKGWSAAARRCFAEVDGQAEIDDCKDLVAEEQRLAMEEQRLAMEPKLAEAREQLKKMWDGARAYYMDRQSPGDSLAPPPAQFPSVSVGPTPPLGDCCAQGGQCQPMAQPWEDNAWTALQFAVDEPHYFSYTYASADPLTEFTVRANGDLDCDGVYSTFEILGIVNPDHPDFDGGPLGREAIARVRELE